ncbi:MAG: 30S ribosomal protein S5 [Candidatus Moranbacteria bacterium CG10_big_fil_rev_8_21_14_0_10_35_21]|nr:MAG: 30S ribosomal protein S5 [Candidatus Moranbacteria bacterium CG10_big_fil_rev_8_21_14_0_10_35_21]PJA88785.1 MAG: 30S ribosomal protein S5 [Candidatus Moranbacteria bacterium CG_4_9_14_3_um_filter_36_9]
MAKGGKNFRGKREKPEYDQKLLDLARVTRVVRGGRRFRFRATVVIGNRKGRVGVGVGKGADVSDSIKKAFENGKKNLISIDVNNHTILHDVRHKKGSAKIILKPAPKGTGIIAGGPIRVVAELGGIKDIVTKSLGTSNKLNVARAAIEALDSLRKTRPRKNQKFFKENK